MDRKMFRNPAGFVWKRQDLFTFSSCAVISTLIGCLSLLQVSMKFSKEQDLPGSTTRLCLQAAPDSFCALRAVDKSVLLLKPEQELSPESVRTLVPHWPQTVWMQALPVGLRYFFLRRDMPKSSLLLCSFLGC